MVWRQRVAIGRMLVGASGAPEIEQHEWMIVLCFKASLAIVNQGGTTGTLLVLVVRIRRVLFYEKGKRYVGY